MEIKHILAVLVVIMLSGCAAKAPEQPGEAVTPEVTPPVEEQPPVEPEGPVEVEEPEVVGGAADVQVLRGGFDPEELTVSVGTVVTWKNMDDRIHIIVLIDGERSPRLEEGDTFEYKFEEAGTYDIIDAVFGFKGKIIVAEVEEPEEDEEEEGVFKIEIDHLTLSQKDVTIEKGTRVVWENKESNKHKINIYGLVQSPILYQGDSFSYTFNEVGEYTYICAIFKNEIRGTISVVEEEIPEERIRARHILVESKEEADEILEELENGADFIELAKNKSIDPSASQGGDLGYFTSGQMVKEFEDVAFALEVGEISHVIKTQFGYHIIKLIDK